MFHLARSFSLTTKDKSSTCPWGVASRHGIVSWKCTKISLYIDKQKKYERQRTGIKNQNLRSLGRMTAFKKLHHLLKSFVCFNLTWLLLLHYIAYLPLADHLPDPESGHHSCLLLQRIEYGSLNFAASLEKNDFIWLNKCLLPKTRGGPSLFPSASPRPVRGASRLTHSRRWPGNWFCMAQ